MARNPSDTLKDVLLLSRQGSSDDNLANALRDSFKYVILTQAAYDALSPKDSNTIYLTVG